MMKPNTMMMTMMMLSILILTLTTTKTSIMCLNLTLYTAIMATTIATKIKLSPLPFIMFLTIIGGLMIIFLYLAATMWTKKEMLTLKTKIMTLMLTSIPLATPPQTMKTLPNLNLINLFNIPLTTTTILLTAFLLLMLMFTIEIHSKANRTFRRKTKIWN